MTLLDAARQALEALKLIDKAMPFPVAKQVMSQLRQAIEQAEQQEPVAWMCPDDPDRRTAFSWPGLDRHSGFSVPLYTTPPQRKPLTDDEIALIVGECAASAHRHDDFSFARAIERAHGIGGGE